MSAKVFVDTNVLVYSRDASETEKQPQAISWMKSLWASQTGRLSYQVLQEFYSIVTTKLQPGMKPQSAREDVQSLIAWNPIPVNYDVIKGAWSIQDRFHLSWWDSLIVSAAQIADCKYLLSEDLQDDQVHGEVRIVNPFSRSFDSLEL
jgi:predicted nucleic acid-binding protein